MKRSDICAETQHSFNLWGSGLCYEYHHSDRVILISNQKSERIVAHLECDELVQTDPKEYVKYLDRANKIKALVYSNNQTLNLPDTIQDNKIGAIIKNTARTSYYAKMLNNNLYNEFAEKFSQDTGLKGIKIKKFASRNIKNGFYVARLFTQQEHSISVHSCSLTGLMAALSEKTVGELVTNDFTQHMRASAYDLLKVSTRLSTVSMIIDPYFSPESKVNAGLASTIGDSAA